MNGFHCLSSVEWYTCRARNPFTRWGGRPAGGGVYLWDAGRYAGEGGPLVGAVEEGLGLHRNVLANSWRQLLGEHAVALHGDPASTKWGDIFKHSFKL